MGKKGSHGLSGAGWRGILNPRGGRQQGPVAGREEGEAGGTGELGGVHDTWCMHWFTAV